MLLVLLMVDISIRLKMDPPRESLRLTVIELVPGETVLLEMSRRVGVKDTDDVKY